MDSGVFDQGMALLMTTINGLNVSKENLKLWRILLSDLDDQVLFAAVVKICRNTKEIYPGTNIVAMIHEECRKSQDTTLSAEEAWLEVLKAAKKGSGSKVPEFSDTFIAKSVRVIG